MCPARPRTSTNSNGGARPRGQHALTIPLSRTALGLGLRPVHASAIGASDPLGVDFVEAIADNYIGGAAVALRLLDVAASRVPVVLHGVGLDLLGSQPLDRAALRQLKALADRVNAPCVTEHLCWSSHRGRSTHDLLPVPLTPEVARYAAERIHIVQDVLERPFGVENLAAMFGSKHDVLTEAEFVAEVVHQADCGVLLDVNNLWVAGQNLGHDPTHLLGLLDPRRVLYAHLAGQHLPAHGPVVDTHDAPVREEVWALYAAAWEALGPFPTLVEWDAQVPPWARCVQEVEHARTLRRPLPERAAQATRPSPRTRRSADPTPPPRLVAWQDALMEALSLPLSGDPPHVGPPLRSYDPATVARVRGPHGALGLGTLHSQVVFRRLAALQEAFPTLASTLGLHAFHQLGRAFLDSDPPLDRDLNRLGESLPSFLAGSAWSSPDACEAAALDAARTAVLLAPVTPTLQSPPKERLADARLRLAPTVRRLDLAAPPLRDEPTLTPSAPRPHHPVAWIVFRTPDLQLQEGPLPPGLAHLLTLLELHPLPEALARLEADLTHHDEHLPLRVEAWLARGLTLGWWTPLPPLEISR